ncbi:hypothetical protein F511_25713 [Dorcoceras hygrometricum]|uniref:Uncharacterized protein n=1 Tax=Dorcoceras hygrometricum TaxID=472368 RepID=A0A2Z7A8P8_9LAMI|nr:hypothetical protein F511_25713 [Dorcoceras hygrometricum]
MIQTQEMKRRRAKDSADGLCVGYNQQTATVEFTSRLILTKMEIQQECKAEISRCISKITKRCRSNKLERQRFAFAKKSADGVDVRMRLEGLDVKVEICKARMEAGQQAVHRWMLLPSGYASFCVVLMSSIPWAVVAESRGKRGSFGELRSAVHCGGSRLHAMRPWLTSLGHFSWYQSKVLKGCAYCWYREAQESHHKFLMHSMEGLRLAIKQDVLVMGKTDYPTVTAGGLRAERVLRRWSKTVKRKKPLPPSAQQ